MRNHILQNACSSIFIHVHWFSIDSSCLPAPVARLTRTTSLQHQLRITLRWHGDAVGISAKFDRQWTFIFGNLWNNFDVISSETHLKRRVSIAEAIVSTSHLETSAALNFAKCKTLSPSAREKGQSRFNATPCNDSAFTWLTSTPCLAQRAVCT